MNKHCDECDKEHEIIAFCTTCKVCLYKHSKQVKDELYPFFECLKCGKVNFWD